MLSPGLWKWTKGKIDFFGTENISVIYCEPPATMKLLYRRDPFLHAFYTFPTVLKPHVSLQVA